MTAKYVVTGTGTDIGKTVFSAALVRALGAYYWKPVQSGLEGETDSGKVARLANIGSDRIIAEAYCLKTPVSPHLAAEMDDIEISLPRLSIPDIAGPLVVEGAGGALVPIRRNWLFADQFARWNLPVIVVASTGLGTINHSLMTIEALRSRDVPIHGVAFIGDPAEDSEAIICNLGGVRRLGRLPILDPLNPEALTDAFATHFRMEDFA